MPCSLCSLLCDQNDWMHACPLRKDILHLWRERHSTFGSHSKTTDDNGKIALARKWLAESNSLLISGRIGSAESAKAVLRLAHAQNASIDFSEDGSAIEYAQAVARSGNWSSSIAETREMTDLMIVLNNELLSRFPMLPEALSTKGAEVSSSKTKKRTVLLVGKWTDESLGRWRSAFDEVWTIDCPIEVVPQSLLQWVLLQRGDSVQRLASSVDTSASQLLNRMAQASYTTIVWSASCLGVSAVQLWIEELQFLLQTMNETQRASSLHLTGLNGTFSQVCLWTTGFPGRVQFDRGETEYQPERSSTKRWLERNATNSQSLVVWIDERPDPNPTEPLNSSAAPFAGRTIRLDGCEQMESLDQELHFCIPVPGLSADGDFFRADQVVMARAKGNVPPPIHARSLSDWTARVLS